MWLVWKWISGWVCTFGGVWKSVVFVRVCVCVCVWPGGREETGGRGVVVVVASVTSF